MYEPDPSHIVEYKPIQLRDDLTYVEWKIRVLDRKEQVLMTKTILLFKVYGIIVLLKKLLGKEKKKLRMFRHLF